MKPGDWCARFRPAVGSVGQKPKVSDEALIKLVAGHQEPFQSPARDRPIRVAKKRADLVTDLIEMGMSRTPALKRIEGMVRRGMFKQGDCPWPENYNYAPAGIHIWIPDGGAGTAGEPDNERLLEKITEATLAGPLPLRGICRLLGSISLTTLHRRVAELVAAGRIVRTGAGYHVQSGPPPEGGAQAGVQNELE